MSEIKRVVVVGSGGVGFWLAVALCRDRPGLELIVYDDDDFNGGFGAQRLPNVPNKSMKKVDFLKAFVMLQMRDKPPHTMNCKFTVPDSIVALGLTSENLVVDCTDLPLDKRRPIWESCRAVEAQMLRISYDGNGIVVVARGLPLMTAPDGNYARVPTLAQSLWAGGVGAAAVEKLLDGEEVGDYQMELPGGLS